MHSETVKKRIWKDNIKLDIRKMFCENGRWTKLTQDDAEQRVMV